MSPRSGDRSPPWRGQRDGVAGGGGLAEQRIRPCLFEGPSSRTYETSSRWSGTEFLQQSPRGYSSATDGRTAKPTRRDRVLRMAWGGRVEVVLRSTHTQQPTRPFPRPSTPRPVEVGKS